MNLRPVIERMLAYAAHVWQNTSHDRHWTAHPAVKTGDDLTFGQRAADMMKAIFATWAALFGMLGFIFGWIGIVEMLHVPIDNPQLTILNLILSSLAGLQCFVLLIAAKRADQIAAQIALHTLQNTEAIKALIEQNTALTQLIHEHITATTNPTPPAAAARRPRRQNTPPVNHPAAIAARQAMQMAMGHAPQPPQPGGQS